MKSPHLYIIRVPKFASPYKNLTRFYRQIHRKRYERHVCQCLKEHGKH